MTTHLIHFNGPINQVTAERFRDCCLQAMNSGASSLRIHFSSEGGGTGPGFMLYNFLKSLPIPASMHNVGTVDSIGVIVFLGAARRTSNPHCRFLIHPLTWTFAAGAVDHSRLREYVKILDNELDRYAQIFEIETKGGHETIQIRQCLSGNERILSSEEAVSIGLAHDVETALIPQDCVRWWVPTV